jgi:glycosyltransferase involved in cell wall biosynthesis
MRILIAHKYFFRGGGTATYLLALIEELEQLGHDIIPFTVAYEPTVPQAYREFYVSPLGISTQTHLSDLPKSPAMMLKLLGRAAYSTEAHRKALALVDAAQPDVAYVNNIYNYMSPSILRAFRVRRVPIVMRVADFNMICPGMSLRHGGQDCSECIKGAFWRGIPRRCHKGSLKATAARAGAMYLHRWLRLYDAVDEFVTPSAILRDLLVEAGFPADRVRQVRSFYRAAPASAQPESRSSAASDLPYILYFGRIDREKGLETLVRAFHECGDGVRLLIVGTDLDGERGRLEAIASDIGAAGIEFRGHQNRHELDALIAGCLFTVIPSEIFDNCPMCVLESFAHGKPVVGSRVGGIPEQITPEVGYLFEPGNVAELACRLRELISDADLRQRMGSAARERVVAAYSPEAHCEALLGLFNEVITHRQLQPTRRG